MPEKRDRREHDCEPARSEEPAGLHGHEHAHDASGVHRHAHHHRAGGAGHEHAHTLSFERFTYLISPVHDMDARLKVCAALVLIVGIVAGPPLRAIEFAFLSLLLASVVLISGVPLRWALSRTAIVLPIALGIALFAPLSRAETLSWAGALLAYRENTILIWNIASKAWLSASVAIIVSATTPVPRLFKALAALRMPAVLLTVLTLLYRFTDVFGEQLRSMRRAVASRAPALSSWARIRLYGNLAGNLFVRAYERGERIFAAMLSRGYTGVLPSPDILVSKPADWAVLFFAMLVATTVLLF